MQDEKLIQLLTKLPFYKHLNTSEKAMLVSSASYVTYPKNSLVYNNSIECLGVVLLESGCLRTHMLSEQGRDITLYRLYSGDICILSASCLLKNITFDVSIEAESDSNAYVLNAPAFSKLMENNLYVENFSYKLTIDKFSDVMWTMEQILFMSFDQRLAVFLLDEAAKTNTTTLALTHAQIAKYMGSAREVVSRMLKHFEADGLIAQSRGGITLLDKSGLRKLT